MRGDAVVAQWIFVLAMLIAPVGLIWVVVLDILLDLLGRIASSTGSFASPVSGIRRYLEEIRAR